MVTNEFAQRENSGSGIDIELLLLDHVLCPKQYDGEMTNHASTDYVQHEDILNQKLEVYISQ